MRNRRFPGEFDRPVCEPLPIRQLMAAGDPDLTFGGDGISTINFPGASFQVNDVAIQPNGKIVAIGSSAGSLAATRFNVDGSLDTTFGNQGLFESTVAAEARSVAVAPDGKIVLALGFTDLGFAYQAMRVGRLTANGSFDYSFSGDGIATVPWVNPNYANSVALQNDGKIIVAGTWQSGDYDFVIVRYNTDGTPDTTFDSDALISVGFGDDEEAFAVNIDYNGSPATNPLYGTIVAVGEKRPSRSQPSTNFTICRLRPNGSLDSSFDSDGRMTSPSLSPQPGEHATAVQIQPGGKIVATGTALAIAGTQTGDFLLARYLSSGALDATFGPSGTGILQNDFGGDERALDAGPSYLGGFLVSGGRYGSGAVAAYTPDGLLDSRFSGDGFRTLAGGAAHVAATLHTVAPVRRLVVGGGNTVGRYIDVGSQVFIWQVDNEASEAGPETARFEVARSEPLSTSERIYLNVAGTARAPYLINSDYTVTGATIQHAFQGPSYVDIPANEFVITVTLTPRHDTLVEGDEYASFEISPYDGYDVLNTQPTTIAIRDDDDTGGPTVSSSRFWYETWPQRVEITFSQNVSSSISDVDFQIIGPAGIPSHTFSYDPISNTATLSFSAILPDGDYTARAVAAGIANSNGQQMTVDHVLNFFFKQGDADHNGVVDFDDYVAIDFGFNTGASGFSNGDFNYDGVVDFDDYVIIDLAFNTQ